MSMALPVIQRLLEIVEHGIVILGYEALVGCVAPDQHSAMQRTGEGYRSFIDSCESILHLLGVTGHPDRVSAMISLTQSECFSNPQ
jgi:histidine ammonia-lyase